MDTLFPYPTLFRSHPGSGLRILPLAADPADTVDHLSPESILTLVSRLRDFFPECIVDAGGVRHAGMFRSLAERATSIHLVTPQTIIGVQGGRALIDGLGEDLLGRVTLVSSAERRGGKELCKYV